MANYANLLATIAANIYTNGNQEVTAAMAKTAMNEVVNTLGAGYQFMGVAHPADTPSGYADLRAFWLAGEAGTYTNFGGIVVNDGEFCALCWNGSWVKKVTGAATAEQVTSLVEKAPGKNIFDLANADLYDSAMLTNDGDLLYNAAYSAYTSTRNYVPVKPNITYSNSTEGLAYRTICFYDSNKNQISGSIIQMPQTFTTPLGAAYVRMTIYVERLNYSALTEGQPIAFEEYSPIAEYLHPDDVVKDSDNIVKNSAVYDVLRKLKDEMVVVNTVNIFNDTLIDNTMLFNDGSVNTSELYQGYKTTPFVEIEEETSYCGSIEAGDSGYRKVCFYDSEKVCLGEEYTVQYEDVFTTPSGCSFVRITILNGNAPYFMIAKGNEPIKYQPYNPIGGYLTETESPIDPDAAKSPNEKTLEAIKRMKMAYWSELQFGLFIHWGVYSAWAGQYDGLDIDGNEVHTTSGTEWMWWTYKIPKATYKAKATEFSSTGWDADEICRLAQSVGMKYIVLTLRHHEGFSLFPTENCEWDVTDSSAETDIVKQLKDACDRHHLKFCTYVSALLDWNDEGGFGQERWNNGADPYTSAQHTTFAEKQAAYVEEIVEKYDPFVVWYDGGTYITQPAEVRKLFYEAQQEHFPYPIFNERGSGGANYTEAEDVYADSPDTTEKIERCNSICGWGYNSVRAENIAYYSSVRQIEWDILESIGRGFNYLLNISPKGDGSVPELQAQWLENLATLCRKYTFFNGSKRLYNYSQPYWGRPLYIGKSVYLFVIPGPTSINVDSILTDNIKGVHIYDAQDPDSTNNWAKVGNDRLIISNLPNNRTDNDWYVVVRIDFYNDVTCQDYNIITDSISAVSLVRSKNQGWADQTTGLVFSSTQMIYRIGSDENTTVSRFKFNGTTGSKTVTINGTQTGTLSLVVKFYDKNGNSVFSGTADGNNSVSGVSLTNGEIYTIEIAKTGTGYLSVTSISIS